MKSFKKKKKTTLATKRKAEAEDFLQVLIVETVNVNSYNEMCV